MYLPHDLTVAATTAYPAISLVRAWHANSLTNRYAELGNRSRYWPVDSRGGEKSPVIVLPTLRIAVFVARASLQVMGDDGRPRAAAELSILDRAELTCILKTCLLSSGREGMPNEP